MFRFLPGAFRSARHIQRAERRGGRRPLGEALRIAGTTFLPLAKGRREIPPTIWPEILALVVAKQRELRAAASLLRAQIAEDKARQLGTVARQIRRVIRSPGEP